MENSERGRNTRSHDLHLEKPSAVQEAAVRTGHGTTDWFQIGKGVHQVLPAYLTYMQSTS